MSGFLTVKTTSGRHWRDDFQDHYLCEAVDTSGKLSYIFTKAIVNPGDLLAWDDLRSAGIPPAINYLGFMPYFVHAAKPSAASSAKEEKGWKPSEFKPGAQLMDLTRSLCR
jgi:hypothetical protein